MQLLADKLDIFLIPAGGRPPTPGDILPSLLKHHVPLESLSSRNCVNPIHILQ